MRQERLEKAGHCSPKWEVLRSLQQVYGARKVRGCTIIDAPLFFEWAGQVERELLEEADGGGEGSPPLRDSKKTTTTVFWGDDEGPVLSDGFGRHDTGGTGDCKDGHKRREGLGNMENGNRLKANWARMQPGTESTKKKQPSLRNLVTGWREYSLGGQGERVGIA